MTTAAIATVIVSSALLVGSSPPVDASEADQCLYTVVGQKNDGTYELGAPDCFGTYAEVLEAAGADDVADNARPQTTQRSTLAAAAIIATHYDASNYSGASSSVSGIDCAGGGLNVPSTWNDRISSTLQGCGRVAHYENANYSGTVFSTFGSGGQIVGYMDNRTTSIKYFAS